MEIVREKSTCQRGDGVEWVCENCPDRPWDMHNPRGCECGAGAPCPDCNPLSREHVDQKLNRDEAVRRIVRGR